MMNDSNKGNFFAGLWITMMAIVLLIGLLCSCSTNHYFSITSDSMENPSITYSDSVSLTKPW